MIRSWMAALVGVTLVPAVVFAQTPAASRVRLGVQLAVASTALAGPDARAEAAASRRVSSWLAYLVMPVHRAMSVRPELHLASRGAHFAGQALLRANYLDVPLLLQWESPTGRLAPRLFAGPYVGFRRGCGIVGTEEVTGPLGTFTRTYAAKCDPDASPLDKGAMGGFGVRVPSGRGGFSADVRYLYGLADLSAGRRMRHRGISLALGYEFGTTRRSM